MINILLKSSNQSKSYEHNDSKIELKLTPPNGAQRSALQRCRYARSGTNTQLLLENLSIAQIRDEGNDDIADKMQNQRENEAGHAFGQVVEIISGVNFEGEDQRYSTPSQLLYHYAPDWLLIRVVNDLLDISRLATSAAKN
mgnify:CR=1 FL=1|tara:strand:+ start:25601 stop:26023 length:423 start_codon:yes stop_codon:yes gene_type:complete